MKYFICCIYDPNDFTKMKASEKILPREPSEAGHKDVIKAFPNTITQIAMKIGPYQGKYPLHCHILEHEDHEMMRQHRAMHAIESKKCIIRSASNCGNGVCEAGNGENCKNCHRMYYSSSSFYSSSSSSSSSSSLFTSTIDNLTNIRGLSEI
jgi:hypothetical protein